MPVLDKLVPCTKLVCGGLLLAAAGCASIGSGGEMSQPTHHWARADVSVAKYNFHNSRCISDTQMNVLGVRRDSPEFLAYRACMEGEGYELIALSPTVTIDRHSD
ncbi:MAG: hypothetical protein F4Y01_03675 [Gammaproteobacteria bacterium]|nr:hypothetical protein [Gammaproteobacteria bacterium]